MNQYDLEIKVNYVSGKVTVNAEYEGEAIEKALNYVTEKLHDALPELDIEVEAEVSECYYGGNPDEAYELERDRYL